MFLACLFSMSFLLAGSGSRDQHTYMYYITSWMDGALVFSMPSVTFSFFSHKFTSSPFPPLPLLERPLAELFLFFGSRLSQPVFYFCHWLLSFSRLILSREMPDMLHVVKDSVQGSQVLCDLFLFLFQPHISLGLCFLSFRLVGCPGSCLFLPQYQWNASVRLYVNMLLFEIVSTCNTLCATADHQCLLHCAVVVFLITPAL